jgi:hypothetical protein
MLKIKIRVYYHFETLLFVYISKYYKHFFTEYKLSH